MEKQEGKENIKNDKLQIYQPYTSTQSVGILSLKCTPKYACIIYYPQTTTYTWNFSLDHMI
jgi:hypothetical protein